MAHLRERFVIQRALKKLKFSRVITIQGPRQCGKSVFAKSLLTRQLPQAKYISLDDKVLRNQAQDAPSIFLKRFFDANPLIVDEAQKSPDLFDAIKLQVDENTRPGQFVLLGSTEFSRETKVRESLTGRMSPTRLFTFTMSEASQIRFTAQPKGDFFSFLKKSGSQKITQTQVLRHLEFGGFPGIFSIRDDTERREALDGWLKLTSERDIHQFQANLDSELAEKILHALPVLDRPDIVSLSRKLSVDNRRIAKHLNFLSQLFVVHKLQPHVTGGGKALYYLCDVSLAARLGASLNRQLQTWVLHEFLARKSYQGVLKADIEYFSGSRAGHLDFVVTEGAKKVTLVKLVAHERYDLRDFEILLSAEKKIVAAEPGAVIDKIVFGPYPRKGLVGNAIMGYPWEALA